MIPGPKVKSDMPVEVLGVEGVLQVMFANASRAGRDLTVSLRLALMT